MDLHRPPNVPRWLVVPVAATRGFGALFALWAAWKWFDAMAPRLCGGPSALQGLAVLMAMFEGALGIALALGGTDVRAWASLLATGLMTGMIGFSFVAKFRHIPTHQCFCFGGLDLPWTDHAKIAAGLAVLFLAILLDQERRFALAGESGPSLFAKRAPPSPIT